MDDNQILKEDSPASRASNILEQFIEENLAFLFVLSDRDAKFEISLPHEMDEMAKMDGYSFTSFFTRILILLW